MESEACLVCGGSRLVKIANINQVPVFCNCLWSSREQAQKAVRADIELVCCNDCGHIFNAAYDSSLLQYGQQYENSLHYSQVFDDYARKLANQLAKDHQLKDKSIIEIGCGNGDFLKQLCKISGSKGVGFDPAYTGDENIKAGQGSIRFIKDYYSSDYSHIEADFLCCRHVLEHVDQPAQFIKNIAAVLNNDRCDIYFEVPDSAFIFDYGSLWDIIYEHVSYFSAGSLMRLFKRSGFNVKKLAEQFGGQFLGIEAYKNNSTHKPKPLKSQSLPDSVQLRNFSKRFDEQVNFWRQRLSEFHSRGKTVIVWGAGSKGVTFVNTVDKNDTISYLVDINPRKRGKYISGSGQKILGPEDLKEIDPDVVIITNENYLQEIKAKLRALNSKTIVVSVNHAQN